MATYRSFVDGLEALTITDVTKSFTAGPPRSLKGSQLPASWVQVPSGAETAVHKGASGRSWQTLRAELVVAFEAVAQSTQATNFDGTVDMMDNVADAISAAESLGLTAPSYEVRLDVIPVGEHTYWAVVATVSVEG